MDITQAKVILGELFSFIFNDADKLIKYLKLPENSKMLDVGTGMGYFAVLLALNGYTVLTGEPESDNSIYAKRDWLDNAKKVGVDHLIKFRAFDAQDMPFDDNTFDVIFFFGVLHHINENSREKALHESVRTSQNNAVICFIEPNQNGMKMVKKHHPSHPEAADPSKYIKGLNLSLEKKKGEFFDSFILRKGCI
ncbi:MAG: class I SAM-dependent methyltransferase [Syntrophales bacterium]